MAPDDEAARKARASVRRGMVSKSERYSYETHE